MINDETDYKVACCEQELTDTAAKITNAEEAIRQLQRLKKYCMDYIGDFEDVKFSRNQKINKILYVEGQDKLIGEFAEVMDDILMGSEYQHAYGMAEEAVFNILCEIKKQQSIIDACIEQQSRLHQKIAYWKREAANAKEI